MSRPWMQKRWTEARAAVGLPDLHWHDLRHTSAPTVAQSGATLAEIQPLVGHSSLRAATRYQHVAQRRQQELADRLDEHLAARRPMRINPVSDLG